MPHHEVLLPPWAYCEEKQEELSIPLPTSKISFIHFTLKKGGIVFLKVLGKYRDCKQKCMLTTPRQEASDEVLVLLHKFVLPGIIP